MAFWSSRSKKNVGSKSAKQTKPQVNPYHCVEVKIPYDACEAVMQLEGKRYLSADAPILPLPACNQNCKCKFKHHNDRRRKEDRRDAFDSSGIHFSGAKNRRMGQDRRMKKTATHLHLG